MNRWGKNFLLFLATALLATGCAAPTDNPPGRAETPTPAVTAMRILMTQTPEPSSIPATVTPIWTPVPEPSTTPTPEPLLKTNGPYLAYFRYADKEEQYVDGDQELVLMDADGVGRKVITLPSELSRRSSDYWLYAYHLSPDGKWLVYYSGSAGKCFNSGSDTQNYDLALNLLNLATEKTQVITHLLPVNYPNNFLQNAKDLISQGMVAPDTGFTTPEKLVDVIRDAFVCGIDTFAWTSDSRKLAFAGAMDGPSSDVYVYDMETQKIQRMTSGPEEVQSISWSPDEKWIVQSSAWWVGEGTNYSTYAISSNGSKINTLSSIRGGIMDWYNGHAYFENSNENGAGNYGLRLVDIENGAVTNIWDGSFYGAEFDPAQGVLAIAPWTEKHPGYDQIFTAGLYLINVKDNLKTRLKDGHWNIYPFGVGDRSFVVDDGSETYFLTSSGKLIPASVDIQNISVAPDRQHWMSIGTTLKIFDADDNILHEIPSPLGEKDFPFVTWKPDSSGLFIAIDKKLYAFDIPSGKIQLVETNLSPVADQKLAFAWVGKK
jgi:WD40 repeat protein